MIELNGICKRHLPECAQKILAEGYEQHGNWKKEALSLEIQRKPKLICQKDQLQAFDTPYRWSGKEYSQ